MFNGRSPTGSGGTSESLRDVKTTVVLRDVPYAFSRGDLMHLMDAEGFHGKYDFVYLPIDYPDRHSLGTAHINLTSGEHAEAFLTHFDGFSTWGLDCPKVASARWSKSQGLKELVALYQNSPVMRGSLPGYCKPALLSDGDWVPLPKKSVAGRRSSLARAPPQLAAAFGDEDSADDARLAASSLLVGLSQTGSPLGHRVTGSRSLSFAASGDSSCKASASIWHSKIGIRSASATSVASSARPSSLLKKLGLKKMAQGQSRMVNEVVVIL